MIYIICLFYYNLIILAVDTANKAEEKPIEKVLEKNVEVKSTKKPNLRTGPVFDGFRVQMAKPLTPA